jgi:hypothetical protein
MSATQQDIIYQIDKNDKIIFINNEWDVFAKNNADAYIFAQKVINRSIWEFIENNETKHIHQALLHKVRSHNISLILPFRCDSPDFRRFMTMRISPVMHGKIEYCCSTIKVERRCTILFAQHRTVDRGFLRMCSWCNKVDAGENNWLEIEDAIKVLDLFAELELPAITHTMCNNCYDALEQK